MMKLSKSGLLLAVLAAGMLCSYASDTNPPAAVHVVTATAPVNGSNTVQTLTFGAGITGGTFRLKCLGSTTTAIEWSATTATLKANIESAMNNIHLVGPNGVVAAAGVGFAGGHGDFVFTFSGNRVERLAVPLVTIQTNSLTGVTHTLTAALTTPGVTASGRNLTAGATDVAMDAGTLWVNSHNGPEVNWRQIGGGMAAATLVTVRTSELFDPTNYTDTMEKSHALLLVNESGNATTITFPDEGTLLLPNAKNAICLIDVTAHQCAEADLSP